MLTVTPRVAPCKCPCNLQVFADLLLFSVSTIAVLLASGAGIMAADDRQVTTVFTVRPSSHHRYSTNRVSPSVTIEQRTYSHTSPRRSPTMVTLHDTRFVECPWWNDCWTVKTVVGLPDTGPWSLQISFASASKP